MKSNETRRKEVERTMSGNHAKLEFLFMVGVLALVFGAIYFLKA